MLPVLHLTRSHLWLRPRQVVFVGAQGTQLPMHLSCLEEVIAEMAREDLAGLCVAQIMQRWPATIAVFMNCDLHCVGCPVGSFHTLAEAAEAHGIPLDRLMENVEAAIAGVPVRDTRRPRRRRSAAGDEHP